MSKRNWKLFIADILESINKIEKYVEGLTCEQFIQDEKTKDAVVRNLEVIGEAANQIDKYREELDVFNIEELKGKTTSPRVKNKSGYQKALKSFYKYFILLKNGFVVFEENYLRQIIDNINDINKLRQAVNEISIELSGES